MENDPEGCVPVQWRDLHVADAGAPCVRLYRAVVLDALQTVGRYARARPPVSDRLQQRRRELVAWLLADGVAAYAYRVPFELALAIGFPTLDPDAIRSALLVALRVRVPRRVFAFAFNESVLRRHYVRRVQPGEVAA